MSQLTKTAKTGASLSITISSGFIGGWSVAGNMANPTRKSQGHSRALSDSLRASCKDHPADSHCGKCLISSSFSSTAKHRTARIYHLSSLALQYLGLFHQWRQQRDSSNRVHYIPGAWLCNILIYFSAPPEVNKNYLALAAMETLLWKSTSAP